jgi:hypothetical protein
MKTDEELIERLRRASYRVRSPDDPLGKLHRRKATKHRRERLAAGFLAVVVAAGAVGGGLALLRGLSRNAGEASAGSGGVLGRSLELGPGQYFYLKGTSLEGGDGARIDQETWWSPDGSGELRFDTDRPDKYISWPPEGVYGEGEFPLGVDGIFEDVASLSTDPVILEEQLRERAESNDHSHLWRAIVDLLNFERSPNVLPELRAALFEVAAGLEGVTRDDGAEDPVGRAAIALDRADDGDGNNWALFFDPGSHQLMAAKVSWDGAWDGVGDALYVLESAIVDARGIEPSDEQLLFPRPAREPERPVTPSPFLP